RGEPMSRGRMAISFGESLDLDIVVGDDAPRSTGAVIVPQDIHLIMGEADAIEDTAETAADVLSRGTDPQVHRLGTLVVGPPREGPPFVCQPVVYDFQRSPPVREVDVFEALVAAFEEARSRQLVRIAVRPVGTAHAGLDAACFLRLLAQACYTS